MYRNKLTNGLVGVSGPCTWLLCCFWLETWLSLPLGDECEKIENNCHDAGHASKGKRRWFCRLHMRWGWGIGVFQRSVFVAMRWMKPSTSGFHQWLFLFTVTENVYYCSLFNFSDTTQHWMHFRFTKYIENFCGMVWVLIKIWHLHAWYHCLLKMWPYIIFP